MLSINIHPSWDNLFHDGDFLNKLKHIQTELNNMPVKDCGHAYFPTNEHILRFAQQDLHNVKCVILGMEPYPSCYTDEHGNIQPVATGRSFEIGNVDSWITKFKQSSLRNILKTIYFNETYEKLNLDEIRNQIRNNKFQISQPHTWFKRLEQQGVMFLNATLTVEPDKPASHTKLWQDAMQDIIAYIEKTANPKWLLFGDKAQKRMSMTTDISQDKYYLCCHPRCAEFVNKNIFENIPEITWVV